VEPSHLPTSIRKRDGRTIPFEPEKLSRSLFNASEAMGAADAFLARELADSVIHFLAHEIDSGALTTQRLVELVVKVVRELGYPALAKAYEERSRQATAKTSTAIEAAPGKPEEIPHTLDPLTILYAAGRHALGDVSLADVYPRDLASAHREGLLTLMDLDTPREMVGMVFSPNQPLPLDGWELLDHLTRVRGLAGSFVALDGPEHAIAARDGIPEEMTSNFNLILDRSLWLSNLHAILNLNSAEAPGWAAPLNLGALFQEFQQEMENERLDRIALYLLRHAKNQTVYWHLSERDFPEEKSQRLRKIIARSIDRERVEFVFDRPKRPVVLGPGVDRRNPAVLGMVGMNLPRFVDQLGGGPLEPDLFLKKLASLTRFAKSAGHARQDYLRKNGRGPLHEGFLLERATQVVFPMGLIEASCKIMPMEKDLDALAALARRCLATIKTTLETDRPRTLATRIDSPLRPDPQNELRAQFGLLARQQLKFGAAVQGSAAASCLTVFLKRNDSAVVNEIAEMLRTAWNGDMERLRFAWE